MKEETAAWLASAEQDGAAARLLAANGFYSQAVFYTHLWMEKMLKATVMERFDLRLPPFTHNLGDLLVAATSRQPGWVVEFLVTLSPESSEARYTLPPDDDVYSAELANLLLTEAEETALWLRQRLT